VGCACHSAAAAEERGSRVHGGPVAKREAEQGEDLLGRTKHGAVDCKARSLSLSACAATTRRKRRRVGLLCAAGRQPGIRNDDGCVAGRAMRVVAWCVHERLQACEHDRQVHRPARVRQLLRGVPQHADGVPELHDQRVPHLPVRSGTGQVSRTVLRAAGADLRTTDANQE
jgi:hypothetical protein